MTQTTRESAQNIGSALKSIISRYGEMKASPAKLLNVDGEEVAFNKVDTALASIGISIKDASGQFRNFDDVIMELAKKWDSLDNNTQRYIATIMAGNRQQSRFIALVSNYDELNRAMNVASTSENASIVQTAKTLDSLESKANQLKNAFSQLYLDLHIEDSLKGAYDWLTRIVTTVGKLGTLKGALPTLMNIIGLGTGTKSLLNMGKTWLTDQKAKVQLETTEYDKKINEIKSETLEKIVKVNADTTGYNTAMAAITGTNAATGAAAATTTVSPLTTALGMLTGASGQSNAYVLENILSNQASLGDADFRKSFLKDEFGIDEDNANFQALDEFLAKLADTSGFDELYNALHDAAQAATDNAESTREESTAHGENASETRNEAEAHGEAAPQVRDEGQAPGETAPQVRDEGEAHTEVAPQVRDEGQAHTEAAPQVRDEGEAHGETAPQVRDEGNAHGETAPEVRTEGTAHTITAPKVQQVGQESGNAAPKIRELGDSAGGGKGGKYNSTLMKGIGVASGVARLAGTAITAAGAAHKDKSTDTQETSKILTGVGNGLSMAGTGASMGMAFGPWGAAIGAIGGFLMGGIGAILDGLEVTAEEKLAMLKEEAQTAQDESLKQTAKATDLQTSVDNLATLQKAMYNSADDMQAYKDAMNNMASQYPNLISSYDEAGNAIIDLQAAEEYLVSVREQAAIAARKAAIANAEATQQQLDMAIKFKDTIQSSI